MKSLPLLVLATCASLATFIASPPAAQAADSLRATAVVDLSFDEESGDAKNAAPAAGGKSAAVLQNGAQRTTSPFWNQNGKRALLLDAAAKQFVRLAGAPYLDRPDAVTLAFFFLNLHEPGDDAFHGLVAKRTSDGRTNYGVNFNAKSNALQLYVNDGTGFQTAVFDANAVIGSRRLVHLAATFQFADAPAPDDDTLPDDLLVRLYLNGEPVAPTSVPKGAVAGNDAWLIDINAAGVLNDTPLVIGASHAGAEYTSALFDEFLMFSRALEPQEVVTLFSELAGPQGAQLAKEERERRSLPDPPQIALLSLYGLQTGTTTRLTIQGARLDGNPRLVLPVSGVKATVAEGSGPSQLLVDIEIPAETQTGYYPLCVQTDAGVSNIVAVALDELPQFPAAAASTEAPASLPAAFSGTVSGTDQVRVYFQGQANQRLVADLEARRIGAAFDPVLEVKNHRGTPIAIEWGQVPLKGDPRAEVVLPEDGVYFAEIHDLAYSASRRNPFRLILGDLNLVDAVFPPAARRGADVSLEPVGRPQATAHVAAKLPADPQLLTVPVALPDTAAPAGPAPVVNLSDGTEIIETAQPAGQLQTVSALFLKHKHVPLHISGRISAPSEVDRYQLVVTPGETLTFTVEGRSLDSPITAELTVSKHPDGTPLASADAVSVGRDPGLQVAIPADVHEIQVSVRDMLEQGNPRFLYRLRIVPANQPDFALKLLTPRVALPAGGSGLAELEVERKGYTGPLRLRVVGNENITVTPAELPPGNGTQKAFITLNAKEGTTGSLAAVNIVGETVDLDPPIIRPATIATSANRPEIPAFAAWLPAAITAPASATLALKEVPSTLWKGLPASINLEITQTADSPRPIRLALVSDEQPRRVDNNDPSKGNLPMVRIAGTDIVPSDAHAAQLQLAVPVDVAQPEISFVLRADLLPHPYSSAVQARTFSPPFRLPVQAAAAVQVDQNSLVLKAGAEAKIRGTLTRTPGFTQPVEIALSGLPAGYAAAAVTVPPDQQQFEIAVTAPQGVAAGDIPNVKLAATVGGNAIVPEQPLPLKVQ